MEGVGGKKIFDPTFHCNWESVLSIMTLSSILAPAQHVRLFVIIIFSFGSLSRERQLTLCTMKIVKILATVSLFLRTVAGTCRCHDVCAEYDSERKDFGSCWVAVGCNSINQDYNLHKCYEDGNSRTWMCHDLGLCDEGDWGACVGCFLDLQCKQWCPGTCYCNIIGYNCEPCEGCNRNVALIEGLTGVPDSEDDHKWYTELSKQEKLAHLNEVVCQKHGYGDPPLLD